MTKDNLVYLKHILDSVETILKSTNGKTFDRFLNEEFLADSVIRHFQIIGEASKKVDKEFKKKYPHFPWKEMAGMRNKLVHKYFDVNYETVWKAIIDDLPNLKIELKKIINQ